MLSAECAPVDFRALDERHLISQRLLDLEHAGRLFGCAFHPRAVLRRTTQPARWGDSGCTYHALRFRCSFILSRCS